MSLPTTNLDDRKFQDLVDEAKRMIPQLCPEWTNHNLSDPGVALIELFAWMTEMSLYRLNQVPDNFYTHMLNLLGFEQFPASAARCDLTFWLNGSAKEVPIPAGTQVTTAGSIGQSYMFTTLEDNTVRSPDLMAALTSEGDENFVDVWEDLKLGLSEVACFPRTPVTPGDCFYLGFEGSLAGNAVQLTIEASAQGIGVIPDRPPLVWEVWQGEGWVEARLPDLPGRDMVADTTGGLNRDGTVLLLVPNVHEPLILGGTRAYWIRARLTATSDDQPGYRRSPHIRRVKAASIGGTVRAEHSEQITDDYLGDLLGIRDGGLHSLLSLHDARASNQLHGARDLLRGLHCLNAATQDPFCSTCHYEFLRLRPRCCDQIWSPKVAASSLALPSAPSAQIVYMVIFRSSSVWIGLRSYSVASVLFDSAAPSSSASTDVGSIGLPEASPETANCALKASTAGASESGIF